MTATLPSCKPEASGAFWMRTMEGVKKVTSTFWAGAGAAAITARASNKDFIAVRISFRV
jgi:hypothetical protein